MKDFYLLCRRFRLVLLAFLLLPLRSVGATCPGCADQFLAVSSQLQTLKTDVDYAYSNLGNVDYQLGLAETLLASASQQIAQVTDQSVRMSLESSVSQARLYLSTAHGANESARASLSSVAVRMTSLKSQVDAFDCSCSGGSCDCAVYLASIQTVVEMLSADTQTIIQELHTSNDVLLWFYSEFYEFDRLLRARLNTVDDSFVYELENLALDFRNVCASVLPESPDYEPLNLRLAGLSSFDLSNEGAALFSIDGHLDYNNSLQLDAAKSLRYIASNLTSSAGLDWVTNYLQTVQSSFYKEFNISMLTSSTRPVYNLLNVQNNMVITNMFNPSAPLTTINSRYDAYRKKFTNWFDRVEIALLNLNGVFRSKSLAAEIENAVSSVSSVDDKISNVTNAFSQLSNVWTATNDVRTLVSKFATTVSLFTLPDSGSTEQGFTVCPEFEVAGIVFGPLVLPFSDLSGVTDFCRSLFRVLWYAIFAVIGFRMFVRLVTLVCVSIGQVLAIVKALL